MIKEVTCITHSDFQDKLEDVIRDMKETLALKSEDYARGGLRMIHFDTISTLCSVIAAPHSRETSAWYLLAKHLASIAQMINEPEKVFGPAYIQEKFGDARNYLTLLEAMIDMDRFNPPTLKHGDIF